MDEWKRRFRDVNRGGRLEDLKDELSELKLHKLIKRARDPVLMIENSEIVAAKEKEDIIELIIARTKEIEELKAMNEKLQAQVAELSPVHDSPAARQAAIAPEQAEAARLAAVAQSWREFEASNEGEEETFTKPGSHQHHGLWDETNIPNELMVMNTEEMLSSEPAPSEGVSDLGGGGGVGGGKRRKKSKSKKKKKSKSKRSRKSRRKRSKTRRRR